MSSMDVLLVIPFEDPHASVLDPVARRVVGASFFGPVLDAISEFEGRVGFPLDIASDTHAPLFGGQRFPRQKHRSASAVALSTHLEREGLRWHTLDPGTQDLGYWRRRLTELRDLDPKVVGVSTTFAISKFWIQTFLSMVRELFPRAKIVLGGYYYATDSKGFLSCDADVFCVGEGEVRFPEIVKAIRDGRPLDSIPGIYLTNPGGGLRYTGRAEPLDMSRLPPVDWTLCDRIDPPVDVKNDMLEFGVETQRGCVFKCGFCTFRTLTSPNVMTPDLAVERILALRMARFGAINILDATATYPHDRWKDLLRLLRERGGSPHPIWCYARVSDIDEETAQLMGQAGVRQVFIGQESGDQRILNLMRKGTNVKFVRPAVAALARNNISVMFGMIHGYPGEDFDTVRTSRQLLLTVNDGYESGPPVLLYTLAPFVMSDMAGAAKDERIDLVYDGKHYLEYQSGNFKPDVWANECARTIMETGRAPNAPVHFLFFVRSMVLTHGIAVGAHRHRDAVFRWLKLVERGTSLFLAQRLEGRAPTTDEIDAVRRELETYYDGDGLRRGGAARALWKLRRMGEAGAMRKLMGEWSREPGEGPGTLTRLTAGAMALRWTGKLDVAVSSFREGTLTTRPAGHVQGAEIDGSLAEMAKIAVDEGFDNGNRRLKIVDAEGRVIQRERREQPVSGSS